MNNQMLLVIAILMFIVGLTIAGGDKKDELKDREMYCSMVKDQKWPDYRHTYKDECGGKNPPKFTKYQLTD